jgi:hypothetical protein
MNPRTGCAFITENSSHFSSFRTLLGIAIFYNPNSNAASTEQAHSTFDTPFPSISRKIGIEIRRLFAFCARTRRRKMIDCGARKLASALPKNTTNLAFTGPGALPKMTKIEFPGTP